MKPSPPHPGSASTRPPALAWPKPSLGRRSWSTCRTRPTAGARLRLSIFERSTRNLLAAEGSAGVRHHVALSIVGTPTLAENGDPRASGGFFQAELAQEQLVQASMIPYTIVRATQFYEFIETIADASTAAGSVRLPPVRFQPMAAEDAARAVVWAAVGTPVNGIVEVGGQEQFRFDEIVRRVLAAGEDPRVVVSKPDARYFGIPLGERSLVPGPGATIGEIRIDEWLHQRSPS